MIRSTSCIVTVIALLPSAFAQARAPRMAIHQVTSNVKDAGVYHVELGTWTRHAYTATGITADVLYCNTCPSGYYAGLLTQEFVVDEGRIPASQAPVDCSTVDDRSLNSGECCANYVLGFQIGYCSGLNGGGQGSVGPVSINIGFEDAYSVCTAPSHPPGSPATFGYRGTFDLTGLPGAGSSPLVQGCWLVTVDLGASSLHFPFPADGASCTWLQSGDDGVNHLFGWTFQNTTTVTGVGQSYVGPLIAGRGGPSAPVPTCSMVDGTRWDTLSCTGQLGGRAKWPNNLTEDGWGMDTQDRFRIDTTNITGGPLSYPSGAGCYYFGGDPYASFHLRVWGSEGCCPQCPGTELCRPSVTGGPVEDGWTCPCTNNQPTVPGAGCNALNSVSNGGGPTGGARLSTLIDFGSLSHDTLSLTVTHLPLFPNESAYLLSGTTLLSIPLVFGQGLRCCGGNLKRLQIHTAPDTGSSTWPAPGDFSPTISGRAAQLGDTIVPRQQRCYFVQYRASNIEPGCVFPNNFNASGAKTIVWGL